MSGLCLFKYLFYKLKNVKCSAIINLVVCCFLRVSEPSITAGHLYSGSMYNLSLDAGSGCYALLNAWFTHSDFQLRHPL